jgi:signal transduction histidine kinase
VHKPHSRIEQQELALALKEFSAHAAHEISNPLNNIGLNAELSLTLLRLGRTAEVQELLERLLKDCWSCAREVRSFARLGESLAEPAQSISVAALLKDLIGTLASGSARPPEQFVCELPTDLPLVRVAAYSLNYALSYLTRRLISENMQLMLFSAAGDVSAVRLSIRAVQNVNGSQPHSSRPPLGVGFFQRTLGAHGIGLDFSADSGDALVVCLPI